MSEITNIKAGSKRKFAATALVGAMFAVSACESLPELPEGVTGALAGAGTGALACYLSGANRTECAALIIGGAVVGAVIENQLNESEKEKRNTALAEAIETGESTSWTDPASNSSGGIEVLSGSRTASEDGNGTCETFRETYSGTDEVSEYTICKDADGNILDY